MFTDNTIVGTFALPQAYKGYGVYLLGGTTNKIRANHIILPAVQGNVLGIYTSTADDECYDNHIRGGATTFNCNASPGNY